MEQFNKALSFILGLIVVAVFIVVVSGKFNFRGINFLKPNTTTNITPTVTPRITPKPTSKPWFSFFNRPTATPIPKPTAKPTLRPTIVLNPTGYTNYQNGSAQQQNQQDPNYHSYSGSQVPTSIPNTGIPVLLFPLLGTSLLTGIFLKKKGKRE